MKNILKNLVGILFVGLVVTNIYLFVSGINLSDQINKFDNDTRSLHQENINLEKQKSMLGSLQYAASIASSLDFSKKSVPVYLDSLQFAMKR